MSKQQFVDDEIEEQSGPNWTLLTVGYFAVLAVVITLLRPLHMSMGGIFFSMVIAGVVVAVAIYLAKRGIRSFAEQGITVRQMLKAKYRRGIGYEGLPDEEVEEEQEQVPASFIADRNPLNLGGRFKPSFHSFLCMNTLIVGIRRSGKSNLLAVLVEELARYELPFILFDTMGEYSGLVDRRFLPRARLAGNVEHMGEIPETAKGLLANVTIENAYNVGQVVMKTGLQLVVNLKTYNDEESALIMSEMSDGVNDWQESRRNSDRIPFMFFIDEAQKWFPESLQDKPSDITPTTFALLQESFVGQVVERGGKNGLGLVVATQRYSRLKKSLLQSLWKFYLRQSEEIDLARYKRQGIDPEEAKHLQQGECIAYGPDLEHFTFMARKSSAPLEGHTPGADALAKYTKQLTFESLQKTGAFIDDMQLDTTPRSANRSVSELPDRGQKSRLSVVGKLQGASEKLPDRTPESELDEPVDGPECDSEKDSRDFQPGTDDLLLSEVQSEVLIAYYRDCNSIDKSLAQIRNDKGQGLGGRYTRHARYILEQRGLKKVKKG